ncbi:MAG: hypothetical protein JWN57_2860, partial [Frankiales bacterium]|nr:hypothetical protein [Frankiales bacterium]
PGPPAAPVLAVDALLALLGLGLVLQAAATVARTSPHREELDP